MRQLFLLTAAVFVLAACGERDQSLPASASKADSKAWEAQKGPYTAADWTPGNKNGWEAQLRTRAQTQNEYNRINN